QIRRPPPPISSVGAPPTISPAPPDEPVSRDQIVPASSRLRCRSAHIHPTSPSTFPVPRPLDAPQSIQPHSPHGPAAGLHHSTTAGPPERTGERGMKADGNLLWRTCLMGMTFTLERGSSIRLEVECVDVLKTGVAEQQRGIARIQSHPILPITCRSEI